jgi:hypothetical protein
MWTFLLWLALFAAAGLCYPRRPRTAGALFIVLGVLSIILGLVHGGVLAAIGGVMWIAQGTSYLVKYRGLDAREQHVHYWTAKV